MNSLNPGEGSVSKRKKWSAILSASEASGG